MTGYQIEYRVKRDQTIRYVYEQAEILLDKNGYLDGLVGYIQDITKTKLSNHVLEKEKQLSQLYDNPDVGIWSINIPDAQYVNCSKGIEYITGYTQDDFNHGIQWSSIVFPKDLPQYLENQRKLELGKILHHQLPNHP